MWGSLLTSARQSREPSESPTTPSSQKWFRLRRFLSRFPQISLSQAFKKSGEQSSDLPLECSPSTTTHRSQSEPETCCNQAHQPTPTTLEAEDIRRTREGRKHGIIRRR